MVSDAGGWKADELGAQDLDTLTAEYPPLIRVWPSDVLDFNRELKTDWVPEGFIREWVDSMVGPVVVASAADFGVAWKVTWTCWGE